MKTRLRKDARLLALFAVLASLPLAIWACGDAGDGPGGPTGPGTKYNPDKDYPGATITTRVDRTTVAREGTFGILATFLDANGLPVEGVPLFTVAEDGGAAGYFSVQTNPTLTDANGKASINVDVNDSCPNGSYSFSIATQRAWSARGYAKVVVEGGSGGAGTVSLVSVSGALSATVGDTETYTGTVTETCTSTLSPPYVLQFDFSDYPNTWPAAYDNDTYDYKWTTAGNFTVKARARCIGSTNWEVSQSISVTVN